MTTWQVIGCVPLTVFGLVVVWAMIEDLGLAGFLGLALTVAAVAAGFMLVTGMWVP